MSEEENPRRAGRPRNQDTTAAILAAALELLEEVGLKAVTMEGIAARAGVTKPTVYRRYSSAWAVVLDAFLEDIAPVLAIKPKATVRETMHADMLALASAWRSRPGQVFAPLLGAAQFNPELSAALWERYIAPRRALAHAIFACEQGRRELRPELDANTVIDALYGSLIYKLLVPHGEVSDKYVDALVECVFGGITPK